MANSDAPNGLVPVRHLSGRNVQLTRPYTIASAASGNIFSGDPVKSTGTGKNVIVAAAGNVMRGIFDGVKFTDASGNVVFSNHWPTGTVTSDAEANIIDDPDMLFEVQCDGAFVAADIGATADLVIGTGSLLTGRSAVELESSTIGSDLGVLIYELVNRPDNAFGANAKVLVLINEHELGRGVYTAV